MTQGQFLAEFNRFEFRVFLLLDNNNKIIIIILFDFDHLIPTGSPDLVSINNQKESLLYCGFCHFGGPQSENKRKRKDKQILGPSKRAK